MASRPTTRSSGTEQPTGPRPTPMSSSACRVIGRGSGVRVGRGYRIKVSNRNDRPERIYDMNPAVEAALIAGSFQVRRGQLAIPTEEDQGWVARAVASVKQVMDSIGPGFRPDPDET